MRKRSLILALAALALLSGGTTVGRNSSAAMSGRFKLPCVRGSLIAAGRFYDPCNPQKRPPKSSSSSSSSAKTSSQVSSSAPLSSSASTASSASSAITPPSAPVPPVTATKSDAQIVKDVFRTLYGGAYAQFPALQPYMEHPSQFPPFKTALSLLSDAGGDEKKFLAQLESQAEDFSRETGIYAFLRQEYGSTMDLDYLEASPGMYGLPVTKAAQGQSSSGKSTPPPAVTPAPVITSLSRTETVGGDYISVYGQNFIGIKRVLFNGVPALDMMPKGTTEIQVFIPKDATTGRIRVETAGGSAEADITVWQGKCDNKLVIRSFFYLYGRGPFGDGKKGECDPTHYAKVKNMNDIGEIMKFLQTVHPKIPFPPLIDTFTPATGIPGTLVEAKGQNFYAVDFVRIEGWGAQFERVDNTTLKFTVPEGVPDGTDTVTFVSSLQGTIEKQFIIADRPLLQKITPAIAKPGEDIMIEGRYLDKVKSVSFLAHPDNTKKIPAIVKDQSATKIVVGGLNEEGKYNLELVSDYGRGGGNILVTVVKPRPAITSIEPEDSQFGANAVMRGQDFVSVTDVTFQASSFKPVSITPTAITLPIKWGFQEGTVEIETTWGSVSKSVIANTTPVTLNGIGREERCFGAVGKACSGDGSKEWGWGSQKVAVPVGCGPEKDNWRMCWVVPGSIEHDNCCVRYPSGQMCAGPGTDGKPAAENNHDGNCVKEWEHAVSDSFWWRTWSHPFFTGEPSDLTPVQSSRYDIYSYNRKEEVRGGPSETLTTQSLCAPAGTAVSSKYGDKARLFCCSQRLEEGVVVKYPNEPDAYKCAGDSSPKGATIRSHAADMNEKPAGPPSDLPPAPPPPAGNGVLPAPVPPPVTRPPKKTPVRKPAPARGSIQPRGATGQSRNTSTHSSGSSSERSSASSVWYCEDSVPLYQQQGCTPRSEAPKTAPSAEECASIQFNYMKRERGCPVD